MKEPSGIFKITPGSTSKRVKVTWSFDGKVTAEEELTLEWSGAEVEPSVLSAEFEKATTTGSLSNIGNAIWCCLGAGAAGAQWKLDSAPNGKFMRTILDGSALPSAWQSLPWETIFPGTGHLALTSPKRTVVRYFSKAPVVLAGGWPKRMLIVCGEAEGSGAAGGPQVGQRISVREELEAIEDGLWERRRDIICQVLDRPTKSELRKVIGKFRPQILHFIGHSNGKALIINIPPADGQAQKWDLDQDEIGKLLEGGNSSAPQFVFLNACRTDDTGGAALTPDGYRSLAEAFTKNGTTTIVGMAGDVEGKAAQIYSRVFYKEWLEGSDLDEALSAARREVDAIFVSKPRQAFLACLTATSLPADWLRWPPLKPDLRKRLTEGKQAEMHRAFVDRNLIRSELFSKWLRNDEEWLETPVLSRLVVVEGSPRCGKTDAVRLVLHAMIANGWHARWQELCKTGTLEWLEILERITEGKTGGGILSEPLPGAFPKFIARIGAGNILVDDDKDLNQVLGIWREEFEASIQDKPIALALDALPSGAPIKNAVGDYDLPVYLARLIPGLLRPWFAAASPDDNRRILLILVMTSEQADAYVPLLDNELDITIPRISIAGFPADEGKRALRQYLRNRAAKDKVPDPKKLDKILATALEFAEEMAEAIGLDLSPSLLQSIYDNFKGRMCLRKLMTP